MIFYFKLIHFIEQYSRDNLTHLGPVRVPSNT